MYLVPLNIGALDIPLASPVSVDPHEDVLDAQTRTYKVENGFVLVSVWNDQVHAVTYQTPKWFILTRILRNREMLRFYGEGLTWKEDWPVDFGLSRIREDGNVRSLYSKLCDFMTFRTAEFNARHRKSILVRNAT
jgi:hypothetical protein